MVIRQGFGRAYRGVDDLRFLPGGWLAVEPILVVGHIIQGFLPLAQGHAIFGCAGLESLAEVVGPLAKSGGGGRLFGHFVTTGSPGEEPRRGIHHAGATTSVCRWKDFRKPRGYPYAVLDRLGIEFDRAEFLLCE